MRYDERPVDDSPVHTADLPPTPVRDRNIPATAWVEAPADLLALGDDLPDRPVAEYKRRIGPWLLWRAGPASGGDARYWAARADDTATRYRLRLHPDGRAEGAGPSGAVHDRFRAWKEDLRDDGVSRSAVEQRSDLRPALGPHAWGPADPGEKSGSAPAASSSADDRGVAARHGMAVATRLARRQARAGSGCCQGERSPANPAGRRAACGPARRPSA